MPTISTKWESAGDKEYKDALKEIERGLSQTRAEAKKLAAQYEDDEDSVEALAATNENLADVTKGLNDKLDLQRARLSDLANAYGETDSRTQAMRKSVTETEAALIKSQHALENNTEALEDAKDAEEGTGQATELLNGLFEGLGDVTGIQLPKGLGELDDTLGDVDLTMLGVAGTLGTVAGAFINLGKETLEYNKKLQELSDISNISTEQLQKLEYAGGMVGVSLDTIVDTTKDLGKNVQAAIEGDEELAETFRKLKVPIKDAHGNMRDMDEIYQRVIFSLADMEEGIERNNLAMKLFGESGIKLNPILNEGKEGIKQWYEAAEEMGYVMDEVSQKNMENMSRKIDTLTTNLKGGFRQAITSLIEILSGDVTLGDMRQRLIYENSNSAYKSGRAGRNAAGTDNWRGGLTWVGENGPELIDLPKGSRVLNNQESRSVGGDTFNIRVDMSQISDMQKLIDMANNYRRSVRMGYGG